MSILIDIRVNNNEIIDHNDSLKSKFFKFN